MNETILNDKDYGYISINDYRIYSVTSYEKWKVFHMQSIGKKAFI